MPVKPFDWAKSRLEGVLSPAGRAALARRLMLGSLQALHESACFERIVVVSRDETALALALNAGALTLTERGEPGLNAALQEARNRALAEGATSLLVLASDLPLVSATDIRAVVDASDGAAVVIVPDRRDEGTNALLLMPPDAIAFGFGGLSSQRHLGLARDAAISTRVLRLEGIGFDVDLPQDLQDLERLGWRFEDAAPSLGGSERS
ncbi:MAG TPA: 2-phospho-L-lactate guanylyltransferase [Dehalococcoidia bacterium]|nr:2-phospho-L-lactate guanylyltransferase [Dehalococcoidia bacterium]